MITSLLAVMEAVAAVRRRIAGSHKCRSGSAEELAGVEAHVQSMANRVSEHSYDMSKAGLWVIMDAKGKSPDLELPYGKALGHAGRVVAVAKGDRFRHRGVGSCDRPHFWLALIAGAATICAADKAFADIPGSDEEFGGIAVQPTSGPLVDLLARAPQCGPAARQGRGIGRSDRMRGGREVSDRQDEEGQDGVKAMCEPAVAGAALPWPIGRHPGPRVNRATAAPGARVACQGLERARAARGHIPPTHTLRAGGGRRASCLYEPSAWAAGRRGRRRAALRLRAAGGRAGAPAAQCALAAPARRQRP